MLTAIKEKKILTERHWRIYTSRERQIGTKQWEHTCGDTLPRSH